MSTTLDDLFDSLRAVLHDDGELIIRERAAGEINGTNKVFMVQAPPVEANSYTVWVGSADQTDVTDYALDTNSGVLTFQVAPTDIVYCTYETVFYGDAQLRRYLVATLDWLRTSDLNFTRSWDLATDNKTLNVVLDPEERGLMVQVAACLITEAEARRALRRSGFALTANIGLDRRQEVPNYRDMLIQMREDRDALVNRMGMQRIEGWRIPTGMEKAETGATKKIMTVLED